MSLAHQFLFGYDDGHRLLAGSRELPAELLMTLLGATDTTMSAACPPLVTGLALRQTGEYAFCVTWSAPEVPRAGAVWVHALLVGEEQLHDPEALEALFGLPRPPAAGTLELGDYMHALELDAATAPTPGYLADRAPRPAALERVAAAAYREAGSSVVVHEDLGEAASALIVLWAAQWPQLRGHFSFRTRESATPGPSEFDVTVTAGLRGQALAVAPAPSRRANPAWLAAVAEDAGSATAVREFLLQFGPHEQPDPQRLRRLAALWPAVAAGDAKRVRRKLERHWPAPQDGAALKQALFGPFDNRWWALAERERVKTLLRADPLAWDTDALRVRQRARALRRGA